MTVGLSLSSRARIILSEYKFDDEISPRVVLNFIILLTRLDPSLLFCIAQVVEDTLT
jgi:hypothetical protein